MQELESAAPEQGMDVKKQKVEWCVGPTITVTDVQDPDETEDVSTSWVGKVLPNVLCPGQKKVSCSIFLYCEMFKMIAFQKKSVDAQFQKCDTFNLI